MKRKFENSVRTLEKVRDTYHSQLDISVVIELNTVIAELKLASSQLNASCKRELCLRALQVVGVIIHWVSNIHDLTK